MSTFSLIYGILAFCFFIFYEVLGVVSRRENNLLFTSLAPRPNHINMIVWALLFPVAITIVVVEIITEYILDRRGR